MKIRVACIKYNGLLAGGTERWLQNLAALLDKNTFDVHFYYTGQEDENRKNFLLEHHVKLVKIYENGKESPYGKWLDTDFHEKFNENDYDIIQTAIAGEKEWPFYTFKKPVLERIALDYGVNFSPNVYHSFFMSEWLQNHWAKAGGVKELSSVVPLGIKMPASNENLRHELQLPSDAIIAGFHQRIDDNSFSDVPLKAYAKCQAPKRFFILLGGSEKYIQQAKSLRLQNFIHLKHNSSKEYISKFLNTLDIFAHGRRDGETFGAVFAEALLHKKVCLAHKVDISNAHKETIGCGGYFAESLEDYCFNLNLLFENKGLRNEYSQRGFEFAYNKFIRKNYVKDIEDIYKKICFDKEYVKCIKKTLKGRKHAMIKNEIKNLLKKIKHKSVHLIKNLNSKRREANEEQELRERYLQAFSPYGINASFENGIYTVKNDFFTIQGSAVNTLWTCFDVFCKKDYDLLMQEKYVVFDIGQNIASVSILKALDDNCIKVYGFEPFKETYTLGQKNIVLNNLQHKIESYNFGLENTTRTVQINYNENRPGAMSSVNQVFDSGKKVEIEVKQASTVLAPLLEKHAEKKIVKIDCEGAEYQIFEDLNKNELFKKIDYVLLEYHNGSTSLEDVLLKNGFVCFTNPISPIQGMLRAVKVEK